MLDHKQIMDMHDASYERGQVIRERAADDLVFAWVTQWDDQLLGESQLQYRGEFNILRKAMRQIISDLKSNPVQIDFEPVGKHLDSDTADLMDGLYRTSTRQNTSIEAFGNAIQETVVAGFGCWELVNEYTGNGNEQAITRMPIYEAVNTVYWDSNAKLPDKSDAMWVSILERYSEEGYKDLVEELTGERPASTISFAYPEESYVFPWVAEDKRIYVGRFYIREKITETLHIMVDLMGNPEEVPDSDFQEREESMIAGGFRYEEEITRTRWEVSKYIVSGEDILEISQVPGEMIPVVSTYGERAMVEGEEHYEGITRLSKDPQRLRNFQLSYLADIVSRSPRRKPIFTSEQLQGFEAMYEESGSDNNYPYLLQNAFSADGQQLPVGPVGEMPEQPIPQALAASIDLSRQAVEDVANPGLPQNIADPDLSGKAVMALQNRMDMQSFIYQDNHKMGLRRDAEIFASMAPEVYDSRRDITLTMVDGSRKTETLMETRFDPESMEMMTENDLSNVRFEIYAEIGQNYQAQKTETREDLKEMINGLPAGDPMRNIMMLEYITLIPGYDFADLRKFARFELIKQGIRQPDTEEEMQQLQQFQQNQQQVQDPNVLLAQAEQLKGQADMMTAQIKQFEAETNRAKVEIEASKAGVEIDLKTIQAQGAAIDNQLKVSQAVGVV